MLLQKAADAVALDLRRLPPCVVPQLRPLVAAATRGDRRPLRVMRYEIGRLFLRARDLALLEHR
eukprot:5795504-Prymnesium_polylepis.1